MINARRALVLGLIGFSHAAFAQTGPLIIDRNRPDRAPLPTPAPTTPPVDRGQVETESSADATGVALQQVRVEGASVDRNAIGGATQKFIGQPVTPALLKQLGDAVAAVYADSVVALYTVYVPQQDMSQGVVRLVVSEGYIADVTIKGEGDHKLVRRYANKLKGEKPLLKATLERYMSLMRDIPGLTVGAELLRAGRPGAVNLALDLKEKPLTFTTSLDNRGTARLGRVQFGATLTANGALREGDQTQLYASSASDFEKYRYASITHSTPLGSEGMRAQGSFGYLRTRPKSPPINGDARTASLQLSYPLVRGYTRNVTLIGSLDGVNSDNAVFGQTFSSEHSRALRASIAAVEGSAKRTMGGSVTASRGLDILDARDSLLGETEFTKINVRAQFDQALSDSIALRLRAAGQYSGDNLPSVEQFTLGGEFGRAFESAIVTGDRGIAGSAELGWRPGGMPGFLKGSEVYSFIDGGLARYRERPLLIAQQDWELASAGLGVRAVLGGKSWVGVEGAYALEEPFARTGDSWRVAVSWQLSL
ncbi:ShlB/FhaC/HecB family hemolysin secretion/activation protein [Sphingoaurantiacus capsulatus]|uniref:ShlB/FhaC/HecB family hemolysin secretion/activation protein n=1 Tax=Sphingoaurantiacus capsulatus TaxID=1771310 RepID=A0ABV7XC10_9SPHN